MTSNQPPALAAIFDWDGVIIDSHDAHREAWFQLAAELGKSLTAAQFKESFGMRNETIIPGLFGWAEPGDDATVRELADRKEHLYRESLRATGLDPLPGVRRLLDDLDAADIPRAIGSSTPRQNILTALELCQLEGRFHAIVAAEDVSHGKPDPEVFVRAAQSLEVAPANCIVFEDAHVGIEAATAAGMKSIAVTTTHDRASFGERANRIVDSLDEVSAADLGALTT